METTCRHIRIGKIFFSSLTDEEMLAVIAASITEDRRLIIGHANQHFVVQAEKNREFLSALDSYTYMQPDGIGVHLASKLLSSPFGFKTPQTGTDFYFKLLSLADRQHWRVYFLGDTESTWELLKRRLHLQYPGIDIAGCHHGFFDPSDPSVLQEIALAQPVLVFVGMGVPQQEYWISRNAGSLDVPVMISVGAGLRFMAGAVRRAPHFFQAAGLEWLFRLVKEPVRLWRRYILGIPYFCYLILKQKIGEKK